MDELIINLILEALTSSKKAKFFPEYKRILGKINLNYSLTNKLVEGYLLQTKSIDELFEILTDEQESPLLRDSIERYLLINWSEKTIELTAVQFNFLCNYRYINEPSIMSIDDSHLMEIDYDYDLRLQTTVARLKNIKGISQAVDFLRETFKDERFDARARDAIIESFCLNHLISIQLDDLVNLIRDEEIDHHFRFRLAKILAKRQVTEITKDLIKLLVTQRESILNQVEILEIFETLPLTNDLVESLAQTMKDKKSGLLLQSLIAQILVIRQENKFADDLILLFKETLDYERQKDLCVLLIKNSYFNENNISLLKKNLRKLDIGTQWLLNKILHDIGSRNKIPILSYV